MDSKNNNGLFAGLKNNQKYLLVAMAALAVLLVISLIVLVIASIDFSSEEPDAGTPTTDVNSYNIGSTAPYTVNNAEISRGTLMIVNKDHKYTIDATTLKLVALFEYRDAQTSEGSTRAYRITSKDNGHDVMVTEETAANLHNMLTDLNKSTGATAYVAAGYRTYAEQTDNKPAASGYTDFHTGMMVSLKSYVGGTTLDITAKENEAMYNWLLNNAHLYGFVQRYPDGKDAQTGVKDYLSCFRYVGVAHAAYMKTNNLCLEEYVASIQAQKPTLDNPIRVEVKNGSQKGVYAIYYYDYNGEAMDIQVPAENYTVSGTNTNGIIVTVKLK